MSKKIAVAGNQCDYFYYKAKKQNRAFLSDQGTWPHVDALEES